jgi:hypothetical protein
MFALDCIATEEEEEERGEEDEEEEEEEGEEEEGFLVTHTCTWMRLRWKLI